MDDTLFPTGFKGFGAGARGWFLMAALVCALLCPPLVLAFLFTLALTVASGSIAPSPLPVLAAVRGRAGRCAALRGPPTR